MEWRYNHRIHREDTPVAKDTPPPEIAGAHRYGCRGKTSLPVTVDHVFSNSEKWSNSARFHGVGFTARLMACGVHLLLSGLGRKVKFCFVCFVRKVVPDWVYQAFGAHLQRRRACCALLGYPQRLLY